MGNGNVTLADILSGNDGRRITDGVQILSSGPGRWFVSADDGYSYMGIDGLFYPSMQTNFRRGGHLFCTDQEAATVVSRFYPDWKKPKSESKPTAPDRTKMPVADLAREMAALVPDVWVLKSNLTDFANSVFLELPESRRELLQRVVGIVNQAAAHTSLDDLNQGHWPELKTVFLSAFGESK